MSLNGLLVSSGKSLVSREMSWMLGISPGYVPSVYACGNPVMETDVVLFCFCLSNFPVSLSLMAAQQITLILSEFPLAPKLANLSGWMVFCEAKAISQVFFALWASGAFSN